MDGVPPESLGRPAGGVRGPTGLLGNGLAYHEEGRGVLAVGGAVTDRGTRMSDGECIGCERLEEDIKRREEDISCLLSQLKGREEYHQIEMEAKRVAVDQMYAAQQQVQTMIQGRSLLLPSGSLASSACRTLATTRLPDGGQRSRNYEERGSMPALAVLPSEIRRSFDEHVKQEAGLTTLQAFSPDQAVVMATLMLRMASHVLIGDGRPFKDAAEMRHVVGSPRGRQMAEDLSTIWRMCEKFSCGPPPLINGSGSASAGTGAPAAARRTPQPAPQSGASSSSSSRMTRSHQPSQQNRDMEEENLQEGGRGRPSVAGAEKAARSGGGSDADAGRKKRQQDEEESRRRRADHEEREAAEERRREEAATAAAAAAAATARATQEKETSMTSDRAPLQPLSLPSTERPPPQSPMIDDEDEESRRREEDEMEVEVEEEEEEEEMPMDTRNQIVDETEAMDEGDGSRGGKKRKRGIGHGEEEEDGDDEDENEGDAGRRQEEERERKRREKAPMRRETQQQQQQPPPPALQQPRPPAQKGAKTGKVRSFEHHFTLELRQKAEQVTHHQSRSKNTDDWWYRVTRLFDEVYKRTGREVVLLTKWEDVRNFFLDNASVICQAMRSEAMKKNCKPQVEKLMEFAQLSFSSDRQRLGDLEEMEEEKRQAEAQAEKQPNKLKKDMVKRPNMSGSSQMHAMIEGGIPDFKEPTRGGRKGGGRGRHPRGAGAAAAAGAEQGDARVQEKRSSARGPGTTQAQEEPPPPPPPSEPRPEEEQERPSPESRPEETRSGLAEERRESGEVATAASEQAGGTKLRGSKRRTGTSKTKAASPDSYPESMLDFVLWMDKDSKGPKRTKEWSTLRYQKKKEGAAVFQRPPPAHGKHAQALLYAAEVGTMLKEVANVAEIPETVEVLRKVVNTNKAKLALRADRSFLAQGDVPRPVTTTSVWAWWYLFEFLFPGEPVPGQYQPPPTHTTRTSNSALSTIMPAPRSRASGSTKAAQARRAKEDDDDSDDDEEEAAAVEEEDGERSVPLGRRSSGRSSKPSARKASSQAMAVDDNDEFAFQSSDDDEEVVSSKKGRGGAGTTRSKSSVARASSKPRSAVAKRAKRAAAEEEEEQQQKTSTGKKQPNVGKLPEDFFTTEVDESRRDSDPLVKYLLPRLYDYIVNHKPENTLNEPAIKKYIQKIRWSVQYIVDNELSPDVGGLSKLRFSQFKPVWEKHAVDVAKYKPNPWTAMRLLWELAELVVNGPDALVKYLGTNPRPGLPPSWRQASKKKAIVSVETDDEDDKGDGKVAKKRGRKKAVRRGGKSKAEQRGSTTGRATRGRQQRHEEEEEEEDEDEEEDEEEDSDEDEVMSGVKRAEQLQQQAGARDSRRQKRQEMQQEPEQKQQQQPAEDKGAAEEIDDSSEESLLDSDEEEESEEEEREMAQHQGDEAAGPAAEPEVVAMDEDNEVQQPQQQQEEIVQEGGEEEEDDDDVVRMGPKGGDESDGPEEDDASMRLDDPEDDLELMVGDTEAEGEGGGGTDNTDTDHQREEQAQQYNGGFNAPPMSYTLPAQQVGGAGSGGTLAGNEVPLSGISGINILGSLVGGLNEYGQLRR